MTRNSRLNSLSGSKNKRLLFKVVKTNWTHNNRPFLDTLQRVMDNTLACMSKTICYIDDVLVAGTDE